MDILQLDSVLWFSSPGKLCCLLITFSGEQWDRWSSVVRTGRHVGSWWKVSSPQVYPATSLYSRTILCHVSRNPDAPLPFCAQLFLAPIWLEALSQTLACWVDVLGRQLFSGALLPQGQIMKLFLQDSLSGKWISREGWKCQHLKRPRSCAKLHVCMCCLT